MRIGIDLMGSDRSPNYFFDAILEVASEYPSVELVPICDAATADLLSQQASFSTVIAPEVIEMGESPLWAVRKKRNASMVLGVHMVRERKLDALVSAGNTGGLVATSMLQLEPIGGIQRPALLVVMPNGGHGVVVLDVGANIGPSPQQLLDYARMGSLLRRLLHGIPNPRVGLLNIGVEERKGTKEVQETYRLLQDHFGDCFLGNIEGRSVFDGEVDVMVTDAFTGNVFLKTVEGVSSFFIEYIYAHFPEQSLPILRHFQEKFNYDKQPGGFLCGVDGIIVKCHGHSNRTALANGIRGAIHFVEQDILNILKSEFSPS